MLKEDGSPAKDLFIKAEAVRPGIKWEFSDKVQFGARWNFGKNTIQFKKGYTLGECLCWGAQELKNVCQTDQQKLYDQEVKDKKVERETFVMNVEKLEYPGVRAQKEVNEWIGEKQKEQKDAPTDYVPKDIKTVQSEEDYLKWMKANNAEHMEAIGKRYDSLQEGDESGCTIL